MAETQKFEELISQSPNRRSFVAKLGLASAAVGAIATTKGIAQTAPGPTDVDILNFALNLEYLEAEFYTFATTGKGINQFGVAVSGSGTAGATTGGSQVSFSDSIIQNLALELAQDERIHVTLIQGAIAALGGSAVAKPAINLGALGLGFGNVNDFLTLARIFEDIGVTAYGGAAPLIQNKTILGYAARILAVEALHSGAIRLQVARSGISVKPLDGADHAPPPFGNLYFPTDSNALSEIRTPQQVLFLAYNGANATGGGFFPNGVNGNINTSAASAGSSDGATITANPNPIPVTGGGAGVTTISWNAPAASIIQIRVNSPTGPLFTNNINSGSMATGPWVQEGTTFYLQDVSGNLGITGGNTLATLVVHLQRS
ncbi:MAG: ferritin-like domain-containing protein [Acidobacteriota bacterium]|nr:ferritin-like domain-containing protein [Acidobacteriota bacterium]